MDQIVLVLSVTQRYIEEMMKKKNREIKEFVLHGWVPSDHQIYSTKCLPPSSVSFSFSLFKTLFFLIFLSPFFSSQFFISVAAERKAADGVGRPSGAAWEKEKRRGGRKGRQLREINKLKEMAGCTHVAAWEKQKRGKKIKIQTNLKNNNFFL